MSESQGGLETPPGTGEDGSKESEAVVAKVAIVYIIFISAESCL